MPRFLETFHHTRHDDKHEDDIASASSGRNSRDSKKLLAESSSPPPYTEVSKEQSFGLSSEDKAAATRAPGVINKSFPMDAASHSSSQSDSKGTDPGPSTVRTSLKVCQHENLTFERLQFIKGILYKKHLEEIDIIKNTEEEQHFQELVMRDNWPCKIWACRANDCLTVGTFEMKLSSKPHTFFGHSRGPVIELELHVHWTLHLRQAISHNTPDKVHYYLQKFDKVPLCPHRMMNDPWIQETVSNFRTAPKLSSIDQYMQNTHKSTPSPVQNSPAFDCDHCKTHVKVSYDLHQGIVDEVFVEITRHLGEGVLENDPAWLAQCGIEP